MDCRQSTLVHSQTHSQLEKHQPSRSQQISNGCRCRCRCRCLVCCVPFVRAMNMMAWKLLLSVSSLSTSSLPTKIYMRKWAFILYSTVRSVFWVARNLWLNFLEQKKLKFIWTLHDVILRLNEKEKTMHKARTHTSIIYLTCTFIYKWQAPLFSILIAREREREETFSGSII